MPKALDTRSRLVATAANLLWERSFHATGVDEICRRAEVRRGSFYHFFPSKADLAVAAVRASWEDARDRYFAPAVAAGGSGLGQLHRIVGAVDQLQREEHARRGVYLGCPFGGVGQEMAHQDQRLQAVVDHVFEEHIQFFRDALEAAAAQGEIEPGDLAGRARKVMALLEGALLIAKVANRPDRFTEAIGALPLLVARDAA